MVLLVLIALCHPRSCATPEVKDGQDEASTVSAGIPLRGRHAKPFWGYSQAAQEFLKPLLNFGTRVSGSSSTYLRLHPAHCSVLLASSSLLILSS